MTASDPVDWGLAAQVATRLARRSEPPLPWAGIADDLHRLVPRAEVLVEAETGLRSANGSAVAKVVDRVEWIELNLASFQRLLAPMLERYRQRRPATGRAAAAQHTVTRRVSGIELGLLLGWMSGRVLGQYDLLVTDDDNGQDLVYIVGPNVAAIEHRFGFPAEQFRLWIALHEVTHRAQFTGVPWMRDHYLGLVRDVLSIADADPATLLAGLRDAVRSPADTRQRLQEGGMVALLASPEQRHALGRISGLMALLEGHGDVIMDRAGAGHVADSPRFARVLKERRRQANPVARLVQRLTGLEAKLLQYEAGERFLTTIEEERGLRAVDRCWADPAFLPTIDEIRDPAAWLRRVSPSAVVG